MFIVELAFDGSPQRLDVRPGHREKLAKLRDEGKLAMAGPYPDDSGATLIFNVDTLGELDAVMSADPYYTTQGVTVVRRQEWNPVVK